MGARFFIASFVVPMAFLGPQRTQTFVLFFAKAIFVSHD